MESARTEVTTIIPTRDRGDWLPRTLLSALGQADVAAEVIVVDDGSRTPVTSLLASDEWPRIRVLRHDDPSGQASAWNTGLGEARGGWVALLDDDDVWSPSKLRRELDVAADTGADFVFCGAIMTDRSGVPIQVQDPPAADEHLYLRLLRANEVPSSTLLVKTDLARSLGGFDPELFHLADWDFLVRLSAVARGAMTPETLVGYTIHQSNHHQDERMLAEDLARFEHKHAEESRTSGVSLDRAYWLGWRASARREAGRRLGAAAAYLKLAWLCRKPGHAIRGITLALGGEGAMQAARGARDWARAPQPSPAAPVWLARAANPPEGSLRAVLR